MSYQTGNCEAPVVPRTANKSKAAKPWKVQVRVREGHQCALYKSWHKSWQDHWSKGHRTKHDAEHEADRVTRTFSWFEARVVSYDTPEEK